MTIEVIEDGEVVDLVRFYEVFGNVSVTHPMPAPLYYWRVTTLIMRTGEEPATQVVKLVDSEDVPFVGSPVLFGWDDAPVQGEFGPGVIGPTKENGEIGFGMGHGAYYEPPGEVGPHWVFVADGEPTQIVKGLGMVAGTNHWHVDVVYEWIGGN